jgi:hypothetical protein
MRDKEIPTLEKIFTVYEHAPNPKGLELFSGNL